MCMLKVSMNSSGDYTANTKCIRSLFRKTLIQNFKRLKPISLKNIKKHSPRSLDTFRSVNVHTASNAWV